MTQSFFSYSWRGHRNLLMPKSDVCISRQQARVQHKDHNISHHTYNNYVMCNFSKLVTRCNEKALGNNCLLLPRGGKGFLKSVALQNFSLPK